jgi:hypothetical protein
MHMARTATTIDQSTGISWRGRTSSKLSRTLKNTEVKNIAAISKAKGIMTVSAKSDSPTNPITSNKVAPAPKNTDNQARV